MRKLIFLIVAAVLVNVSYVNIANSADSKNEAVITKSETKSVFSGFMNKLWGKLRAISPKASAVQNTRGIATAGIRGAETTTSIISPYWKDDVTEDPEYIKELNKFTKAQQLIEDGDLKGAVTALSSFIQEHGNSDYKANAQFALAMSYGGLGQKAESVNAFQSFVKDNPKHPLVDDAKKVMAELQ